MAKDFTKQLVEYKNKVNKWLKIMNTGRYALEKNTTIKFIIPLFVVLGWDPLSKEMEFEYPVYRKKPNKPCFDHVDIALFLNNEKKPRIIVEIKPIQNDLSKGTQLLRYLRNSGIGYGIYINGKEIKLISKLGVRDGFKPRVLFHLKNLDDFIEYKDVLWLFSKESFKKNRIDKLLKLYHSSKEYWQWRKAYKIKYPNIAKDRLSLIYAKMKLKDL